MEAEGAGATGQGRPGEQPWKRPAEAGGEGPVGLEGQKETFGGMCCRGCEGSSGLPHIWVWAPEEGCHHPKDLVSWNPSLDLASVPRVARALC